MSNIKKNLTIQNNYGDTPLYISLQYNHLPIVKYLIEQKNIDINIKGQYNIAPLNIAYSHGNLDIFKYLISKGSDINFRCLCGDSALHFAVEDNNLPIVKYIFEQCNVDIEIKGQYGRTLYSNACSKGYFKIVKYLVSKGSDINYRDSLGNTPHHYAVKKKSFRNC